VLVQALPSDIVHFTVKSLPRMTNIIGCVMPYIPSSEPLVSSRVQFRA
jgi:hypothetical protein